MESCDILVVGGGPAGSSFAWKLGQSGREVVILDGASFPRDKVCGGWITPPVLEHLDIDARQYANGRTLQPITAFRTSVIGARPVQTDYGFPVSYGVRRCEFDHYLLARSGARVVQDCPVTQIERSDGGWIVNGSIRARLLVGAGGHFCPVARFLGAHHGGEPIVAAQEIEFLMSGAQRSVCAVRPEVPELFFCADMKGYGWCFRKGDYLNVGLGRMDREHLTRHVDAFVRFLSDGRRIPRDSPVALRGHAYLLYGFSPRRHLGDGVILIGDAAGLAYPQSGEGIRPAVESGLLAAKVVTRAGKDYSQSGLADYERLLQEQLGSDGPDWTGAISRVLPGRVLIAAARLLLSTRWFTRKILVERWFLRTKSVDSRQ